MKEDNGVLRILSHVDPIYQTSVKGQAYFTGTSNILCLRFEPPVRCLCVPIVIHVYPLGQDDFLIEAWDTGHATKNRRLKKKLKFYLGNKKQNQRTQTPIRVWPLTLTIDLDHMSRFRKLNSSHIVLYLNTRYDVCGCNSLRDLTTFFLIFGDIWPWTVTLIVCQGNLTLFIGCTLCSCMLVVWYQVWSLYVQQNLRYGQLLGENLNGIIIHSIFMKSNTNLPLSIWF